MAGPEVKGSGMQHNNRKALGMMVSALAVFVAPEAHGAAEVAQSAIQAPDPSLVARELAFVGFAQNESICAWQQTLHRPHGAVIDSAATAIVVHMANHHVLAVYKTGSPRRTSRRGHFVNASPSALLRSQPEYQKAMPQAAWAHLRRRARFDKIQSQFTDATIRLAPDDDVQMQVHVKDRTMHVAADPQSPLSFGITARLLDGNLITLGHFRTSAKGEGVKAQVRTYFSHTGHSIAVLVHFTGPNVPLDETYQTAMGQTPGSPLADFHIGVRNRTREEGEDLEDLFKGMHPEGAADWDEHVGKLF